MGGEHHRAGPLEYADVTGPNYSYRHTWGDGPFFANVWQGNAVGLVNVGGWHSARVSGHAVLSNGAICTSLHPIGTEAIC